MGFMGLNFPVVDSGSTLTTIDTYIASTATNSNGTQNLTNGATNTPGAIYLAQPTPFAVSSTGVGSPRFVKYVRYNPTVSQTIQAGPAIVYWKDETFTVVTGLYSEAFLSSAAPSGVAGWLLPNTTAVPGLSTASVLNGNWCFIHVGGFLAGCFVTAATAGDSIYGVSTGSAFATAHTAFGSAVPIAGPRALALTTASASSLSDLYVPLIN